MAEWMNLIMGRVQGRAPDIYRPFNYIWIIRSCAFRIIFFLFFGFELWRRCLRGSSGIESGGPECGVAAALSVACRIFTLSMRGLFRSLGFCLIDDIFGGEHFSGKSADGVVGIFGNFWKNSLKFFGWIFSLIFIDMQIESHPLPVRWFRWNDQKSWRRPLFFFVEKIQIWRRIRWDLGGRL